MGRRRRIGSAALGGALLLAVIGATGIASAADLDADLFRDRRLGVKFEVPPGWLLSRQTGFPALLAILTRSDSSAQITLATAVLPRRANMDRFIADSVRAMERVGLSVENAGTAVRLGHAIWRLSARRGGRGARPSNPPGPSNPEVRQYFLQQGRHMYVFTLSCASKRVAYELADLDLILASLEFEPLGAEAERSRAEGREVSDRAQSLPPGLSQPPSAGESPAKGEQIPEGSPAEDGMEKPLDLKSEELPEGEPEEELPEVGPEGAP